MLTAFERTKNYANRMSIGRSLPLVVWAATTSPNLAVDQGAAKVDHLKVVEQPRRTFFASCFPTTSTTATTTTTTSANTSADRRMSTYAHPHPHPHARTPQQHQLHHRRTEMTRSTCVVREHSRGVWGGGEGQAMDRHWEPEK